MNYSNLETLLEHIDNHFDLDTSQDFIHDEVHGHWANYPCTVARHIKRSHVRDTPLYTILTIRLEGQTIVTWGCESDEDERRLATWFGYKSDALSNHKHSRRVQLEHTFKHNPTY